MGNGKMAAVDRSRAREVVTILVNGRRREAEIVRELPCGIVELVSRFPECSNPQRYWIRLAEELG